MARKHRTDSSSEEEEGEYSRRRNSSDSNSDRKPKEDEIRVSRPGRKGGSDDEWRSERKRGKVGRKNSSDSESSGREGIDRRLERGRGRRSNDSDSDDDRRESPDRRRSKEGKLGSNDSDDDDDRREIADGRSKEGRLGGSSSDKEEIDRGRQEKRGRRERTDNNEDDRRGRESGRRRGEERYDARERDYERGQKSERGSSKRDADEDENRRREDEKRSRRKRGRDSEDDDDNDGSKKLGRQRDENDRYGNGYKRVEGNEKPYTERERERRDDNEEEGLRERRRRRSGRDDADEKGRRRREVDRDRGRDDRYEDNEGSDRKERRREKERERDREREKRADYEGKDSRRKKDEEDTKYSREERDGRNGSKEEDRSAKEREGDGGKVYGLVKDQKPENLGRSGGVYIPPFKLARMMKEVQDKSSTEYQRMTWDALRKSINGLVNKVNAINIKNIIPELFAENLIRGRGLFCRSCMKSQMASPGFTDVFAALVAVVNTKFPEVGELLLKRISLQLQRAYKRNDKPQLLAAVKFIAHLVNQQVVHELIALELLTILLENPTDDSVEVAVGFVTECGSMLQDLCPRGLHGIFERFRGILHEGEINKRVQFLIEGLFALRKAKFQGNPAVRPELDLVEQEDQLTHEISLSDKIEPETALDIFQQDPNFLENEKKYEDLKKSILGEESEDEADSDVGSEDDGDDEEESDEEDEQQMEIKDETETNLVNLRRTIYLTIMSSVDFEEAGHKLLKIKLEPGQEMELCIMLLECCSQERTYLRYYGLLGQRFCMINKVHQENFETCFVQQYSMIHRLETNKLRNVAKFFAHLLGTDALPWHVLSYIRLTEEDTTSSSRIFIKILFQELSEHLGIRLLNERLNDPTMIESFESIFPRDNPKNTRFSINFFTSIGLGGITENLREYLKNMPRLIMQQQKPVSESDKSEDESGSSSSSDSESGSSSTDESSSESDDRRAKRRRRN